MPRSSVRPRWGDRVRSQSSRNFTVSGAVKLIPAWISIAIVMPRRSAAGRAASITAESVSETGRTMLKPSRFDSSRSAIRSSSCSAGRSTRFL